MTKTQIHWFIIRFILATVCVVGVYGEAGVFTAVAIALFYLWAELYTGTPVAAIPRQGGGAIPRSGIADYSQRDA